MASSSFNRVSVIEACDAQIEHIKKLREQRYEKEVNDLMKIDQTPSFVVWWCKLWKIYHIPQFLTRKQAEQVMTRTGEYSFEWSNAQYISNIGIQNK